MTPEQEPAFPTQYVERDGYGNSFPITMNGLTIRELSALTIYAQRVGELSGGNAADCAFSSFQQADVFLNELIKARA